MIWLSKVSTKAKNLHWGGTTERISEEAAFAPGASLA